MGKQFYFLNFERCVHFAYFGVVAMALPLAACGEIGGRPVNELQHGYVCVDRFVVDLFGSVDVGGAVIGWKKGVVIDGIKGVSASGVSWGGVGVSESLEADSNAFLETKYQAKRVVGFIGHAQDWLDVGLKERRKFAEGFLKSSDPRSVAAGHESLALLQKEEERVKHDIKVSGEAVLKDAGAFAYRHPDGFVAGYLSEFDKRVRVFEGAVPKDAPDNAQAAAMMYEQLRSVYRELPPGEVPQGHGYCTGHGFIKESADQVQWRTRFHLPYRSLNHPNLIITFEIQGRDKQAAPTGDIRQADNPNSITLQDIRDMKGWGALGMLAGMAEIKRTHGPEYLDIAGQKGRIIGREYKPDSGAGAAYEFEAEVLGVPGQIDKPAMRITMAAALPDPDPLPAGEVARRPALKGTKPPPFKEGLDYFRKVLLSMRPRPVVDEAATARSAANAP